MSSRFNRDWLWALALVLAVVLTYQPVWYAGFIWDDNVHVTENPTIVGPLGLKEIWTTPAGQFFPLSLTTFWLENALWGLSPLPFHLVNVFQQAACAVLLWRVLLRLRIPGAWLGSALWALHPLQVESVAWITELKNTQSCLFYLLTIFFFLRWLPADNGEKSDRWNYLLCLICAFLALASKSTTCVLPAVLVLCALWVGGRWHRRNLMALVPITLMSLAAIAVTVWPRPDGLGAPASDIVRGWPERLAASGDVIWFYLGKLVWPYPLMTMYPRWKIDGYSWLSYLPLLAAIAGMSLLWFNRKSSWIRPAFFAFTYFLLVLSPFLGFLDQSFWQYSFVEDHLQYLAAMGPLALAGSAIVILGKERWLQTTLAAGLLFVFGLVSWERTWTYENEGTVWTDELAKNPDCWAAHNNLGNSFFRKGQLEEAIGHFQEELKIRPTDAQVYNNLGLAFAQKGQPDDAIVVFQKALKINPGLSEVHNSLGSSLDEKGRLDEAIEQYQEALKIDPDLVEARNNLGIAFCKKGRVDEGITQFQEAVRLNPKDATARANLAKAQVMARQAGGSK